MKRFTDFIIRYRVFAIIIVFLLTLFFGYKMTGLKMNADFSTYLRQDDPLVQQFNRIGEEFGGKSIALILIESEQLFTTQSLEQIRKLTDVYEDIEGVSYVTSLTNVLDFKKRVWGFEVGKLLQDKQVPQSSEELQLFKKYVISKEMYTGNLVSEDGTLAVIVVRLLPGFDEYTVSKQITAVTEQNAPLSDWPEGTKIYYGGMPFLMFSMSILIQENFTFLMPVIVGLILLILAVSFRRLGGVLLPLTVVLVATVWATGLMAIFGLSITMLSGIMPVILIALGSADGIHLMKRYYEQRRTGETPSMSVRTALGELGAPMIMTTITTIVGFASLAISDFSVIRQFGFVTALGVFLALLVTFTLLTPLLSFSRAPIRQVRPTVVRTTNRVMENVGQLIYRKKMIIIAAAVIIVIVAGLAIPRIKKDVDWSLCLQKGSDPYHAEMLLRKKFGGSVPIMILVQGDVKTPATLKTMRFFERYLETVPYISKTQSIARINAEMNDVMNDRFVVPETKAGVANLWFLIEGEEIMGQMVNSANNRALIMGKLETMDTEKMVEAVDQIERFLGQMPAQQVVLDLESVTPDVRNALLDIRKQRITDMLIWDSKKRGIDLERSRVEGIVGAALSQQELPPEAYVTAQRNVLHYLLSEESEIEITSLKTAKDVARSIVEEMKRDGDVSTERIAVLLSVTMGKISSEDASLLAESLERLLFETTSKARTGKAFQMLEGIFPAGSDSMTDSLLKDLKGSLWEMNEDAFILGKDEYQKLSNSLNLPQGEEFQISFSNTGLAPILNKMEKELTPTQVRSLLLALIFVALLLTLMFRSVLIGLVSIIPIILTISVNFTIMSFLRIGLDSWTAMIASIAIGLGIDYVIHFNSRFKHEYLIDRNELGALKRTLSTTGIAIVINAVSVGLAFTVLLLAGGQHLRRFGGLTALTMFTSAIFTLMVLPAITLLVKPKYMRKDTKIKDYIEE
jgi:predicted RND superfamily exporter protein